MSIDDVTAFMESYFRRLHAIELSDADVMAQMKVRENLGDESSARAQEMMDKQIANKRMVYREFWNRTDDYWEPSYLTDDPDHDWERVRVLDIKCNELDCFAIRYTYSRSVGDPYEYIMLIKLVDGKLRIVDELF